MELHKLMRVSVKLLPWILAVIYLIGTIFASLGIDLIILSYVGYTSLLPALYILLSSFTFKACIWHRLPLYFILINNIINLLFWILYGSTPLGWVLISFLLTIGLIAVIGAYLKNKHNEQIKNSKKLSGTTNI